MQLSLYKMEDNNSSLLVTALTFTFFLICLPSWVKWRWKKKNPRILLGLHKVRIRASFRAFFKGILWAFGLLGFVLAPLCFTSWIQWEGSLNVGNFINGIVLGLGVAFAEELIFRGWFWGEANLLFGSTRGVFIQSIVFSLVHIFSLLESNLGVIEVLFLLIGLFFLGLVLSIRRLIDNGSIYGCIGLHGGLVGLWFVLNTNFIDVSLNTPTWLIGPGGSSPNPVGGVLGISCLALLLFRYRMAFAIAGRPFSGARNASSNGAIP
ncbi:CPBP family intramembrane glutamic endopeptidase [Prochlorococcus sp. MIT 0603]|uniref:CPBP family glutamic-type intramembrane protease n=2 Tax=Prochlorococcus sp. MIT 0603 TaxID=1499500 RepID=UPI001268A198